MKTILWLALISQAPGQQVNLPPEIHGQPGSFVSIPATSDSKSIQWVILDPGLNLFPVELLRDTTTAVVTTTIPGKYRVLAYCAKGDQASRPAITTVTIGGGPAPPPAPPTPVPPTPNPPAPPAPPPAPPDDIGKLGRELQSIYRALNEPGKKEKVVKLSALYTSLAKALQGPDITTAGELLWVAREAAARILTPSDLAEIRGRLQSEMKSSGFPEEPTTILDAATRQGMVKKFQEFASVLEKISQ